MCRPEASRQNRQLHPHILSSTLSPCPQTAPQIICKINFFPPCVSLNIFFVSLCYSIVYMYVYYNMIPLYVLLVSSIIPPSKHIVDVHVHVAPQTSDDLTDSTKFCKVQCSCSCKNSPRSALFARYVFGFNFQLLFPFPFRRQFAVRSITTNINNV